ncbi:MAG: ABC transporter permease [Methylotenera sp.]|nr:ABC transporter permease [Oligoflexia bacterium]
MKNTPVKTASGEGAIAHLMGSPWTAWVGFRYLKSKKNSKFLSFITLISVLGVALGVTAMIVVLSVMDGFEAELKKRLMSTELHVLITPTVAVPGVEQNFAPSNALSETRAEAFLKSDSRVDHYWPVISTEAILKTGKKVTGVVIKGVTEERLSKVKSQVTESAEPQMLIKREGAETSRLPGVFVGQELAYELSMIPGDEVTLISPTETEGPLEAVPRLKRYVVEGIYKSGVPEQELHTVFAADSAVRSFLRRTQVVSQWEVTVKNFDDAPDVATKLRDLAPGFRVQDWIQLNAHLFASLKLERIAMFIILAFIIIVASFNIVTTLTLMVLEKKREISILKAMGARNGAVAAIFLAEGIFIGGSGVGLGLISGALICSILKRYEFITLPDIYYDRTLPVTFQPSYYAFVGVCALIIVITACFYPSKRAALIDPLEGIRFG